eukprot:CAMPEP_0197674324 /NCGR_PEP_ID=MMETSP1338-20131121/82717_1 /TAXON_ID=43686 ORGANISM="Pelagodinium beii, Strain RCC1491" /NCGR_SAMPLE_ID=MMETSP1338 /ASSEMBLY_ACC=CAM_ASM_000754 /LENGTH=108 /DNA_ID=CAMNT_0043254715 /DNA_START=205 /DNA_END=528 /DNA_ORIENTATION=+
MTAETADTADESTCTTGPSETPFEASARFVVSIAEKLTSSNEAAPHEECRDSPVEACNATFPNNGSKLEGSDLCVSAAASACKRFFAWKNGQQSEFATDPVQSPASSA